MIEILDFKLYQEKSYWMLKFANVPSGTKFFAIFQFPFNISGLLGYRKTVKKFTLNHIMIRTSINIRESSIRESHKKFP
jgi:hypothetical protein